ncbi:MAG: hypothetical protein ABI687_03695, partial [Flavitalea sp.]
MIKNQSFALLQGMRTVNWLSAFLIISVLFAFCKPGHTDQLNDTVTEIDGIKAPAGFSIQRVASPDMLTYPMFGSFDEEGRLFIFESDGSSPTTEDMLKSPSYHVRLLEDTDEDGIF